MLRVYEHKGGLTENFSKKYEINKLVYVAEFASIEKAIIYEKRLKEWNIAWKLRLIEEQNPNWEDFYACQFGTGFPSARE